MRKLKVLELYSGTRSIGKAFEAKGHEVYSVDWDRQFKADWYVDVEKITPKAVLRRFGRPDVIWMSPDCTTYSVAAISHHRAKDPDLGGGTPLTDYARKCDRTNVKTIRLLLALKPLAWWIENPRAMMRKMPWMQWAPRYTVTFCQYGDTRQKPTDLWTNVPNPPLRPPCEQGAPCHVRAPRGARTGTQGLAKVDRSRIPDQLCEHVVEITEDYIERLEMADEWLASQGRASLIPRMEV